MSWSDYIRMPYSAAMAAMEGYIIRIQKEQANFREIAFNIYCAFTNPKDPGVTRNKKAFWHIPFIDKVEEVEDNSPDATKGQIINLKERLCRM